MLHVICMFYLWPRDAWAQLRSEQYSPGSLYHKYANVQSFDSVCFYGASLKLSFPAHITTTHCFCDMDLIT